MQQRGLAAGLLLDRAKTVIVFMGDFIELYVRDSFEELGVDLGSIQIRNPGKGLHMEWGGGASSWKGPLVTYARSVREVRGLGLEFVETIMPHKTFALPVMQYVAELFEPPVSAHRLEDECMQLLVNGPRRAAPRDVCLDIESCGANSKVPQLRHAHMAASYRTAKRSIMHKRVVEYYNQIVEGE
eukprot:5951212-Pyramimonas_sp.AAC.1